MNKGKKFTGGGYHSLRKKKSYEVKGQERKTILGAEKRKILRTRGGNIKTVMLSSSTMNISVNGKVKKAEIKNVIETPQNKFLARQNRLMKGSVVETDLGKAKITNRPSQEGRINGVLIQESK